MTHTGDEGSEVGSSPAETRLSPRLFSTALRTVDALIGTLPDHSPLTLDQDWGHISEVNLPPDTVTGKRASISGQAAGVYYALEFRLYNEAAGTSPNVNPGDVLGDLTVRAQEGSPPDTADHAYNEKEGAVYGLIIPTKHPDIDIDFKHGTRRSANPRAQAVLDKIIGLYGFTPEEMFGTPEQPNNGYGGHYDDAKMQRFLDGLHKMRENPDLTAYLSK